MSELVKYSKQEEELYRVISSAKDEELGVVFPDDLDPQLVVQYSESAGARLRHNEGEKGMLIAVLGRLHSLARNNPEVLRAAGCSTVTEYEDKILGVSKAARSSIWVASTAYLTFPKLTPAQCVKIGSSNLVIATRVCRGKDLSEKQKNRILEAGEEGTDQFREFVEERSGISGPGETKAASFDLFGTEAEILDLRSWLADPRFLEATEEDDDRPIALILASIKSYSAEWKRSPKNDIPPHGPMPQDGAGGGW